MTWRYGIWSPATSTKTSHRPLIPELVTMYRPNFCSECGEKIIRLRWHPWTSRRFCGSCSQRLRKEQLTLPLIVGSTLLSIGLVAGRSARPASPPLIIQRSANSPLYSSQDAGKARGESDSLIPGAESSAGAKSVSSSCVTQSEEVVYLCGARTKKGTPCSRRVHGLVRCWQHKGRPAMLPAEKLIVRG